jgi:endonuclease/exonuclease/phosphatase family metal-dependent hydrolase
MFFFLAMLQAISASVPGDVSVMSFNIRYGTAADGENAWAGRRPQLIQVIERHDPDVLGTQEALEFQLKEILAELPEYGMVGVGRDDGAGKGEFAAILYRRDRFEVRAQGTFWFSPTPDIPGSLGWGNNITRICSWARLLDRQSGRYLLVYNVHLDHESAPSRERSAELLARRIAERGNRDPVIVMGDFNAGEEDVPVRYLRNQNLVDTFRKLHPDSTGVGTYHAFTGRTGGAKIDHILVSPEWTTLSSGIDRSNQSGRYPSDHFPVHANLRLAPR